MLEVKDIKKSFKDKVVLNGVNITIEDGNIYGLIGANGAGKTTLMNIISGLLSATSGEVYAEGKKIRTINDATSIVGYVLDIPAMFDYLSAEEYLAFLMSAQNLTKEQGSKKIEELLKKVGLSDTIKKRIKKFSRGMKQRLGIAAGLVSNPKVILFDEPTSALDPQGRHEVMKIIEDLKKEGRTIILSTHILNDVERVCDKVGLLVDGVIKVTGTIHDVLNQFKEDCYKVVCSKNDAVKILDALKDNKSFKDVKVENGALEILYEKDGKKEIFSAIVNSGADIESISEKVSTIEDIFLKTSVKEGE